MDTQQKGCKVEIDTNDEKVTVLQKKSMYKKDLPFEVWLSPPSFLAALVALYESIASVG